MAARPAPAGAYVLPLLLLLILCVIKPVGYVGGGGDDWYYVEAARCAAGRVYCLPETHWAARFPLVAPLGWSLALLGESRATAAIVPLVYAGAATILFALNVQQRFGRAVAIAAGCVLVLTPVFTQRALQPNVDTVELTWLLAAIYALQRAADGKRPHVAALAGALLACAVFSRLSALACVPIIGVALLAMGPRGMRLAMPFAMGFAALLCLEGAVYWYVTGNPFSGWLLSLHHTRIPSTELAAHVDLAQSPLLNPAYIAGWKRPMGIELHWTIDPLLNLLAHPEVGLTMLAVPALMLVGRRETAPARDRATAVQWLLGAAAVHFALLTYVLAIDPKPRMFLPEAAVAATLAGLFAVPAWRTGSRAVVAVFFALLLGTTALAVGQRVDFREPERLAAAWAARDARPLAVTDFAARTMTFAPGLHMLPVHPASGATAIIALAANDCVSGLGGFSEPGWRLERSHVFSGWSSALMRSAGGGDAAILCLFSRAPSDRAESLRPSATRSPRPAS